MVISEIASYDFPEKWPNLLNGLVQFLQSNDSVQIYGSITCLSLVAEHFSTQQLPTVFPKLVPFMNQMVQQCPPHISEKSLLVNYWLFQLLGDVKKEHPKETKEILKDTLPLTLKVILEIIAKPSTKVRQLKMEAMKILSVLIGYLKKDIEPYAIDICKSIFSSMSIECDLWLKDENDDQEPRLTLLMIEQLELIEVIIGTEIFSKMIKPNIETIIDLSLKYMIFTQNEIELWEDNPNSFVSETDDESVFITVRCIAKDIIIELCGRFENGSSIVVKKMIEHFKNSQPSDKNWWKMRESCLFALGAIHSYISSKHLNMEGFFKVLLQQDLDHKSPDYLKSTALWFLSKYISFQNEEILKYYIQATMVYLRSNNAIPVKLNACRSLARVLKKIPKQSFDKASLIVMQSMCDLLNCTNEDTTHIVLESINILLIEFPQACVKEIFPLLLNILNKYADDKLIKEDTMYIFDTMAQIEIGRTQMIQVVLPLVLQTIKTPNTKTNMIEICIDLIGITVSSSDQNNISNVLQLCFDPLMEYLKKSDDDEVLLSGTETIKIMIHNGAKYIKIESILSYISQLLNLSDSACQYLPGLLSVMLKQYKLEMNQYLPQILKACIQRFLSSEQPTLNQNFLVFFSKLICFDFKIIDFFENYKVGDESSLILLCKKWIIVQPYIFSEYNLKVTMSALIKVLLSGDKRFSFTIKKEEVGKKDDNKRVTRSNSKTILKEVPFALELFVLIVKCYNYVLTDLKSINNLYSFVNGNDEEEEEEGDDLEDDDNVEGGFDPKDEYDSEEERDDIYTKDDEFSQMNLLNFMKDGLKQIYIQQKDIVSYSVNYLNPKEIEILKKLL